MPKTNRLVQLERDLPNFHQYHQYFFATVVRTRLPRRTPSMPKSPIRR